ncbi:MAG: hypothetical protein ABEI53_01625 [Candidatus Magasanikbacteria bacterium]
MFKPLPLESFKQKTGIDFFNFVGGWEGVEKVVSLRGMKKVFAIQAMPHPYLRRLLDNVTLKGDSEVFPYKSCEFDSVKVDPNSVRVGQTFVQRSKYQGFIEDFPDLLDGFCANSGIANRNASILLGENESGTLVVAHYLPPIIEKHNGWHCLLDGIHRNFLSKNIGMTIESIVIKGVDTPFPCDLGEWSEVEVVEDKPSKPDRFFNLKKNLFRDLKKIGIDG